MTALKNVTHRTVLPTLASLLVGGRRIRKKRRTRKERSTMPAVRLRKITNLGRRTQLVSKTRKRSSKASPKHYSKSAGKHQFV
jgi:hypothetical protein